MVALPYGCNRIALCTPGYLTESTVFEDPAIKYDNMGDVSPTTIENYLVSRFQRMGLYLMNF